MIISHEHQYVFVEIAKNACQSVRKLLITHCGGLHFNAHGNEIPVECKDYTTFCIIRNPYARFISLYYFILKYPEHRCHPVASKLSLEEFAHWMADVNLEPSLTHTDDEIKAGFQSSNDDPFKGRDINQGAFIRHLLPNILMLHLDYLRAELEFLPFIGSKVEYLERINIGSIQDWRSLITPKIEKYVYQWAKDDFDLMGFQRLDLSDSGLFTAGDY